VLTKKTGAIDDVHRAVAETMEEEKRAEGKKIIEEIAKLKYELQHDRKLTYNPHLYSEAELTGIGLSPMMASQILQDTTRSSNN
jgi:hypothetical protein